MAIVIDMPKLVARMLTGSDHNTRGVNELLSGRRAWSRRRPARAQQNHQASRPSADDRPASFHRNENRDNRACKPMQSVRHGASYRTQHRAPADSTPVRRARASLYRPDDRAIFARDARPGAIGSRTP